MKKILIICAMEKEAKYIAQELKMKKIKENLYENKNIELLISGIGKKKNQAK